MIKYNNDQMLKDKTQFLNRLGNSGCTVKSNTFGQSIKSPYLAQYKIFQERLKNPKLKTMSMIMRKRKIEDYLGKQNIEKELKKLQQEQSLKEAHKIMNNDQRKFTLFSNNTIDYDVNQNSRQSEVMLKFKQKLNDLKMINHQRGDNSRSRISTLTFITQKQKYQRTQIAQSVGSQRTRRTELKPFTAQMFIIPRDRIVFKQHQSFTNVLDQKRLKPSVTFITYKRNKSFAQKLAKDKK